MASEAEAATKTARARAVFISYSVKDRALAEDIRKILTEDGHTVWMAPHSIPPGHSYAAGIMEGINNAEIVFLVMTRHSNASGMVEREIERAVGKKKILIGLRADDFAPTGALEYFLSRAQWVEITDTDQGVWSNSLRAAARDPAQTPPPPSRDGLVALTTTNLLALAGVLSLIAAIGLQLARDQLPAYAPGALLLIGLICLFGAWIRARRHAGLNRFATLRWADIAVVAAIAAGLATAYFWLLLTPLVAAIALAIIYFAVRSRPQILGKHLWRRGRLVAVAALLALAGAVGWAESAFYRALQQTTNVTLVLLPEDECPVASACAAVPSSLYSKVRNTLSEIFESDVGVYPFERLSEAQYAQLIGPLDREPRARGLALVKTIWERRDVFDTVLTLQVNYQRVACGSDRPALDFEIEMNNWRTGRWPTWAFWEDAPLPEEVKWDPFEATVDLSEGANSPVLEIATVSMAARMLLAASTDQKRFGGARAYAGAVRRLLTDFARSARVVGPPGDNEEQRRKSQSALDALRAARQASATPQQRLDALKEIADAYAPLLQRRRSACDTELDVLASRVAPRSEPAAATADGGQ